MAAPIDALKAGLAKYVRRLSSHLMQVLTSIQATSKAKNTSTALSSADRTASKSTS
jgi:hypothetical protein